MIFYSVHSSIQFNGCVGVTECGSAFQHPFCGRKHFEGREKACGVISRQVSLSDWRKDYISFVVCFGKLKVNCLFPDEKLVSPVKEENDLWALRCYCERTWTDQMILPTFSILKWASGVLSTSMILNFMISCFHGLSRLLP